MRWYRGEFLPPVLKSTPEDTAAGGTGIPANTVVHRQTFAVSHGIFLVSVSQRA